MDPIINSSFNKYPMSWKLIHFHLLHPSYSVMKAMCCHQTLIGLPQQPPKKITEAPFTVCYTKNMKTLPKGTAVNITTIQPGELMHMNFDFYNFTSILSLIYMLNVVLTKTTMLWVFSTASKIPPVIIIIYILTTLDNEKHPCRRSRVDKDGTLENSTDVNLLINEFR